ncbi:glycosyltransferase family 4 protein [Roseiconus lacunae]|uniref:glycosyltransferase family 4 protein n=1 Tax=Roseiconus lacunae TaxID=2605694 RepID=UPI00308D7336|nr:glycosyltransferase family 4 protein [Stieleria sp. HD01]
MNNTLVLSEVFPPQRGGSGKWLWEIYKRLDNLNFAMAVGNGFGELEGERSYPHPIERLPLSMPRRSVANLSSLYHYTRQARLVSKVVRRHEVTMIHAARPLSEGLLALAMKLRYGMPYVCYTHGEDISVAMTSRELQYVTSRVLAASKAIIANSTFTAALLQSDWSIDAAKIKLMHPGVDTTYFQPAQPQRQPQWANRFVILTVGRLQPRKGYDTVIRAIPHLVDNFPNLLYVIAGGGEYASQLKELVAELGIQQHVAFLGEISDDELLKCYQECDVFVLANRTIGNDVEGFGIVLLEAQACEKPVVAGKSGGTKDTMQHEKSGFLIDATSPDELVSVLKTKLATPDLRSQMGRAGREFVVRQYDWASLSRRASELFQSF